MPSSTHHTSTGIVTSLTCSGCDRRMTYYGTRDDAYADTTTVQGEPISPVFRYLPARGRFHTTCRHCERAANRARPRRKTAARVPGTTGRPLGLNRTFGVEIECILPSGAGHYTVSQALAVIGITDWTVKYDGSLRGNGAEVVSPVLYGEDGIETIRRVTRILRDLGATVNRSCGLHVHHGIRDLRIDDVKAAARAWFKQQDLIDGLVSPSRRDGANTYCGRLTAADLANLDRATDLRNIYCSTRYRTFNLAAYGRYGTVEIRQHQGTLDAEKIVSWIRFGQAILDTALAAPATITEQQHSTMRDLFAALGERLDETARTFLTGRTVEFGAVAI